MSARLENSTCAILTSRQPFATVGASFDSVTEVPETVIQSAVELLRRGGVVAFPTDTVYGIGADYRQDAAVERLYRIKGRSQTKAIALLLADVSQMSDVAQSIPDVAWLLARQFMPGGLTLVLRKGAVVSDVVSGGLDTVAVRVPQHPVAIALIAALGRPLATTSANCSGEPSPTMAIEVRAALGSDVDLIIDGGRCPGGVESTVVDVSEGAPRLLRQGLAPWRDIVAACGAAGYAVVDAVATPH